ncbi:tubulin monoglutamylase TTLL4 [Megalopta genalis]|uniref:tubulin monoglutamylase TTLL4 n=1 Tax=Megalopta genalis TaxID=115081 RepID=UPI0014433FCE|nr:tubulin polyglutamylase TTLL4-like [Megalopta genalis]XP_033326042.1 tubulin polyglutamylase TTLL4-like [Megalopta genalis]
MPADFGQPAPIESVCHRCASTSTFGGMIDLDLDEEWLLYAELTERAFLAANNAALIDNAKPTSSKPRSGSNRIGSGRTAKNKTDRRAPIQPKIRDEVLFDEGADGDRKLEAPLPMRHSLFPHVPPYILFQSHENRAKKLSKDLNHLLQWKSTNTMPRILVKIILNSGYRIVNQYSDWSAVWYPSFRDISKYQRLKNYQKVNSIPGSYNLGNKDLLWTNLSKMMKKFGQKEYSFMPRTYILPREIHKFEYVWQKYRVGGTWIVKPPTSGRGQGIKVINQWWEIPKWHSMIVQRYISRPRLINGSKFDLRLYVLVTSINPTRIYIYKEGLVRFASVRYIRGVNLSDKCMHLTNTSVNKLNPGYVMNDGLNALRAHKWSFGNLWGHLAEEGVDATELWRKIKDIVVKTLIAAESSMNAAISECLTSRYSCYELYGFDVLLDENFKPWLLEVNILPSLHTDSPLDTIIKGPLVRNVLNMAGYQIPKTAQTTSAKAKCKNYDSIGHDSKLYSMSLSLTEKTKQNEINAVQKREDYLDQILETLTRDDIRQLIRYEDELAQIGNFEKIFPAQSTYPYLRFFEVERYYDRLLDAWEHRYCQRREEGIERLRKYCEQMRHLDAIVD